jgi:hydrogenase expression/formation protein HypE
MSDQSDFLEGLQCAKPIDRHERIQLAHGSGGRLMSRLIRELFVTAFDNPLLRQLGDGTRLPLDGGRLIFTTDSYVIDPPFFPGGNIGDLAVYGTVNDLAVCGAKPRYLSAGMILEEGFPIDQLRKVVESMAAAARTAGIEIVTGDTKVVNKGKADRIFINTAGIGILDGRSAPSPQRIRPGDRIILSGTIADHGIAVLSCREGLTFESKVCSDSAPLNGLVDVMMDVAGESLHAMRDVTRGGLAAVLNEISAAVGLRIEIMENQIPLLPEVEGACELLGLDPLYVANEGRLVAFVSPDCAEQVLEEMKQHPHGQAAVLIGTVHSEKEALVTVKTGIGGRRILDLPIGEQLPRIC